MKNAYLLICLLLQTAVAHANEPCYPVLVTLKSGTSVTLEVAESIASHKVTPGKLVQFRVRMNVVVNGRTVVSTGATAIGRVKSIEKASFNFPEKITLEVTEVQAVDGQMVALNPLEQTFEGEWPNEPMTVHPGQIFQATVMNNIEILTQ